MVTINGTLIDPGPGVSLAQYLKDHQYNPDQIAVELNEVIISKEAYSETFLKDGDCLEIVNFVCGG